MTNRINNNYTHKITKHSIFLNHVSTSILMFSYFNLSYIRSTGSDKIKSIEKVAKPFLEDIPKSTHLGSPNTSPKFPITSLTKNTYEESTPSSTSTHSEKPPLDNKPIKTLQNTDTILPPKEKSLKQLLEFNPYKNSTKQNPFESSMIKTPPPLPINTTPEHISDEALLSALKIRGLIKTETSPSITIETTNNTTAVVGDASHKAPKLSQLGSAYFAKYIKKSLGKAYIMESSNNENSFIITTPPKITNATFLRNPKQKHLLLSYNQENDSYFALGYLTSKNTNKFLASEQLKVFLKNLAEINKTPSDNSPSKSQYFREFPFAERLGKEDVEVIKNSPEYIQSFSENTKDYISKFFQTLRSKPAYDYDTTGITKEDCINICMAYDNHLQNNIKHPLTDDQIKLNAENKLKQQEKNKHKLLEKDDEK